MGLSVEALQEHSIAVAEVASHLEPGAVWREDAYLAGLLHDMGLLIMATRLTNEYRLIDAQSRESGAPRMEIERRVLGCHHGDIGAYLFGLWGLPAAIIEAVSEHADLELDPQEPLNAARAVAVAEELVGAVQTVDPVLPQRFRFSTDPRWAGWLVRATTTLAKDAA